MHVPTCFGIMHYHHQMWYLLSWMDYSFSSLSIILEPILAFLLELTADWIFWTSNKMIVLINYEVVLYELNKRNRQSMKNYKNRIKPKFGFYLGEQYQLNKHIELSKTMINKTWIKKKQNELIYTSAINFCWVNIGFSIISHCNSYSRSYIIFQNLVNLKRLN